MTGKYVLIGNSAAALAAVDGIRRYDRDGSIVLLSCEPGPAYSRVALPYFVAGELPVERLFIRRPADYVGVNARLVENAEVTRIDRERRQVELRDGRRVGYEKTLIATGSACVVPPIPGLEAAEPHYLWTLADAKGMKAAAARARTAVIIGGGFIGMLVADALRKLQVRVTIVEMAPQLLPQLLDSTGGKRFLRTVTDAGVTVRLNAEVVAVAKQSGCIAVTLRGGETLAADMVAVAAGVRPNMAALVGGSCATTMGVPVNAYMETDCPGVYAAGDVAEARDFLSGDPTIHAIWPTAVEQGRVAGANMTGKRIRYPGSLGMNVVELFSLTLVEVGRFREAATDDVTLLGGNGGAAYRKVVLDHDGRVVGGLSLGDGNGAAEMGVVQGMIKRRASWRELSSHQPARVTYAHRVHAAGRGM